MDHGYWEGKRRERKARDERYRQLRQGATPLQRFGMFAERHGEENRPSIPDQARHSRQWYGRVTGMTLALTAILVTLGLVLGMSGVGDGTILIVMIVALTVLVTVIVLLMQRFQ
ncbi:hypothetical protein [Bifidobacterium callimiconis]|uniref:Uncharacterized protein n=1 Tax=Bifidobacterium callimiconis TaxID=2306973 RepID=A0A430FIH6_9BIFI|nr:hypothetical protein [Bifidobacterium callimiconis]MBT1176349.1 hypothetical protein [Bifidobacterium callimiconis]RSX52528.1 hypothetical protein D2E23_0256 [Bifidobacterium callimiconis]